MWIKKRLSKFFGKKREKDEFFVLKIRKERSRSGKIFQELDGKDSTDTELGIDHDITVMFLYKGFGKREADTDTVSGRVFGFVEAFKDMGKFFPGNAASGIRDSDFRIKFSFIG